jgi:hypothetical protein
MMKTLFLIASLLMFQDTATTINLVGRVTVDDGSALPTVNTFRGAIAQVGLQALAPGTTGRVGNATMNTDGTFSLPLAVAAGAGEFVIVPTMVPLGYHFKSVSHGPVDLLRSNLKVTAASNATLIQVVLTKVAPVGSPTGVKVSGRITNSSPNAPMLLSLQATQPGENGSTLLRIGTTDIKPDGTFEINGVPPGRYRGFTPAESRRDLLNFDVETRDVSGLEIALANTATPSIIITSDPFRPPGNAIRPSPPQVAGPTTPPQPSPGSAVLSVSQSGRNPVIWYEGALHFFRVERTGTIVEEKRLEGVPLAFTLPPGSYELRGYSRACDGNCGNLDAPEISCAASFSVTAGQVLYAERVFQPNACTIQFKTPPAR